MAGDIKFIVDLVQRHEWPPELSTAVTMPENQKGQIISLFETHIPENTYWTAWGGSYDIPTANLLKVLFKDFLSQVMSREALVGTQRSFYVEGSKVYIHTDYWPWQYKRNETEVVTLQGFSSQVPNPDNPSDDRLQNGASKVRFPVRLTIPSVMNNKISDIISGIVLYNTFGFELCNEDGFFDKKENTNFFNTPVTIKKTNKKNPVLSDYKTIRSGLVGNFTVSPNSIIIEAEERNRTFDDPVCKTFSREYYPDIQDSDEGKDIPVAWGNIYGAELTKVGANQYIVCDPAYLTTVDAAYDSDGNSVAFTVSEGILSADDQTKTLKRCDFRGSTDNQIGQIITSEIQNKSNYGYFEGNWDISETDKYISRSAKINLFFNSGNVKKLVKECLKNDNAFLLNKNDGRLTLRQWGGSYGVHNIPDWMLTKIRKKTYMEQKHYASSVRVNYLYHEDTEKYEGVWLNKTNEEEIVEKWRKQKRQDYNTLLSQESEAVSLSQRLLDRFSDKREIVSVDVGYDTSLVNPLDTVILGLGINNRAFSETTTWIVREVNPAQDSLVLEAMDSNTDIFGESLLSHVTSESADGLLSMSFGNNNDALLSAPFANK